MNRLAFSFIGGLVFALGLGISGMTNANKVIGFLNLADDWDPSLAFVMIGALIISILFYRFITKRSKPMFDHKFYIPTRRDITAPLMIGASIFGIGWGMAGFCPGPGLVSIVKLELPAVIFVLSMLIGMSIHKFIHTSK